MKKIICAILTLALLVAMSMTAFASEITDTETGNSQEVLASFEEGVQDKVIISVDIGWNKMTFTYKGASEPVWDASEHRYVGEYVEAHWMNSDATVSVTNHSNTILKATLSYAPEADYGDINMLFTDAAPSIGSAYTNAEGTGVPCTVTVKAILTGALNPEIPDNTRIGTVTVRVEPSADPLTVTEIISDQFQIYASKNPSELRRGDVYFSPDVDVQQLQELIDTAIGVLCDDTTTTAEQNVAFNAMLVAYYGALAIVQ